MPPSFHESITVPFAGYSSLWRYGSQGEMPHRELDFAARSYAAAASARRFLAISLSLMYHALVDEGIWLRRR